MIKKFLAVSSILFLLTACNWNPNNEYHAQQEDVNGTNLLRDEDGSRKNNGFYEQDLNDEDYYDINTNPNFIDLTEDRPDFGDLQDKLEQVVKKEGYQSESIYRNGNEFWVNVKTDEKMSKKELKKASKALHKKLIYAAPDYRIHVDLVNE